MSDTSTSRCDRHQHALAAADVGGYWPHCIGRIIEISSEVVGYWQTDEVAGGQPRFHVDLVRGASLAAVVGWRT